MALSDKKILQSMKEGSIVIEPFKRDNLSTSSYDVTLGEWFFAEQHPPHFENLYNIYDRSTWSASGAPSRTRQRPQKRC